MLLYTIRRLSMTIPVLFGVTLGVFLILQFVPGDPARIMAGPEASNDIVQELRQSLGLNDPMPIQFGRYVFRLLHGDMGRSYTTGQPVALEVFSRFPATLELTVVAMFFAVVFGLMAGTVSAVKQYSIWDHLSMFLAIIAVSMPVFWLGLMLMLLFAVLIPIFPATGRDGWQHIVLPAISLGAWAVGIIARMHRSSMLEIVREDYIRTARAKGLREQSVVFKHALKNALIPTVTIIGLQFGRLMGGAVLTETVFAWPGLGRLIVEAVNSRDFPLAQGAILVAAFAFVLLNLIVDLLYAFLNPRIHYR